MATRKTHGAAARDADAGIARAYQAWHSMRGRCLRPTHKFYADYGGRGIGIDAAWDTFEAFLADMGPCAEGLTLERIDNNQGYSPTNCKWATPLEQGANKRNNRLLTFNGETRHLSEWVRITGLSRGAIDDRARRGRSADELLAPRRFSRDDAATVRALAQDGMKGRDIARQFGISPQHVCGILKGRAWKT